MVPIVLGAYKEDYENVLPPHSYINVDDFDSIQELAEYLQFLDKNDTAYAQYFAWTKHGRIIVNSDSDKIFGSLFKTHVSLKVYCEEKITVSIELLELMYVPILLIATIISSKLLVSSHTGMVPIVLGAYKEDYKNVLPPHSYINVDEFDSIQELAEYLQFLDKNDTAYAQYFAWTKHGPIIVNCETDVEQT
ncbi:unnamed protein product [Rodentolepis nana]|uniref:Fucosyltransferase n=1 Tax=Rodentolepis nana TaxID=102285 RepID=A0A0R3TBF3_RODNA|nr:unnamed protein product [Rodentolepis nana]